MSNWSFPSMDSNERESTRPLIGRFNPRSRQSGRFESLDSPKLFNFEIREKEPETEQKNRTQNRGEHVFDCDTNIFRELANKQKKNEIMNDQKYVPVNQGTANQSGGLQKIQLIQSNGQGTQMINGQPVTLLQVL